MLVHIVCFKYKADVDAAAFAAEHCAKLKALADIDGIVEFKAGVDVVRAARSYHAGLVVKFRDREALDAYAKNPRHLAVIDFAVPRCEHIVAVDFFE